MNGYVLARLNGVKLENLKHALKVDAPHHLKEGLCLEHIWQNTDNPDEVLFLFRTDDLVHAQKFIKEVHAQALQETSGTNLPTMIFLKKV